MTFAIERGDHKGRLPKTTHRREPHETRRCQVFHYTGSGFCLLAGYSAERGLREDWICKRIGFVPVEENALWLVQCHGDLSKRDDSGFDQDNEEIRESRDVLRGRRGHSDTHLGRSHRQTCLGLPLHEESRPEMQTVEM